MDNATLKDTLPPIPGRLCDLMQKIAEDDLRRNVWDDEPPEVWVVTEQPKPLGFPDLAVVKLPVPDSVWERAEPPVALLSIARVISESGTKIHLEPPAKVRAVAFSCESWELAIPEGATEAQRLEAYEFSEKHGIADHPWGMECKSVFAVDATGWQFAANRRRNGTEGRDLALPPYDNQATGRVPQALSALMDALR